MILIIVGVLFDDDVGDMFEILCIRIFVLFVWVFRVFELNVILDIWDDWYMWEDFCKFELFLRFLWWSNVFEELRIFVLEFLEVDVIFNCELDVFWIVLMFLVEWCLWDCCGIVVMLFVIVFVFIKCLFY